MAILLPTPPLAEVQDFLRNLSVCLEQKTPGIILMARPNNEHMQNLFDLKIKQFEECIPYLKALTSDQFSHHQESTFAHEAAAKRHLWVFGVIVGKPEKKQRAVYVKIQLGRTALDAVCISFHRPVSPLNFPFSQAYSNYFDLIYNA